MKNHNANCLTFDRNTRQPNNRILCLFGALALHLRSNNELEQEIAFLAKNEERDASKIQGSQLNDTPKIEDILQLHIFLLNVEFLVRELIGELARRGNQKYDKSVKLLRYNNHICCVGNIDANFKPFRCIICDTFLSTNDNIESHLGTSSASV